MVDTSSVKLNQCPDSPWYQLILTVLGVFTGLFGSLYASNIKSSFPFYWGDGEISYVALSFWCLLILFSILFYFRHAAVHKSQNKLIDQTIHLETLIKTLPPDGFLTEFSNIYKLCNQAAKEAAFTVDDETEIDIKDIELAIRVVLDGVVALAYVFDGKPHNTRYAANIMCYKEIDKLTEPEIDDVASRIQFIEPGVNIRELKGVLDLDPILSTTTETTDPLHDDDLRNFALPLPENYRSDNGERYRILPGAPMAFELNQMSIYPETNKLAHWCRENGDFSPSLCDTVEAYFSSDAAQKIKSFASMPLCGIGNYNKIGVLNIHRDTPGLLEEKEPVKQFFPLMQPFLLLLVELILMLKDNATE